MVVGDKRDISHTDQHMTQELTNRDAHKKACEFVHFFYEALGTIYDSLLAYRAITQNPEAFLGIPNHVARSGNENAIRQYDRVFSFQKTPGDLDTIFYVTSAPDIFFRSLPSRQNERYIVNMFIVHVFQVWECAFRPAVARLLNIPTKELRVPIMGDLCKIRNSLLHNGGVANSDCDRCEVIKDFRHGDKIVITSELLWRIKEHIADSLNAIGYK